MRAASVLLLDYDKEIQNTRRTLERVPPNSPQYSPHSKSMPLGKLAMHCATTPLFGLYIMEDDGMDLSAPQRPHASLVFTTPEACLGQLDESAARCRDALARASDEHLSARWPFRFGEQISSNASRALSFRHLCFDHLIHHTAQLGVYLRLNDIPVPALYGPSADEPWASR